MRKGLEVKWDYMIDTSPIKAFMEAENKLDLVLYQLRLRKAIIIMVYGLKFRISGVSLTYTLSLLYWTFERQIYWKIHIDGIISYKVKIA